jgi:DME family drug/metabolite transporter
VLAEVTAILSAMGWAADSILVRLGLRNSNIFAAMLLSFAVSAGCIWTYLILTTSLEFLRSPAMIYFLVSGCLQPLIARALFYEGIIRLGVSRAGPLRGAEPLFATVIAVIFLHEQPGLMVYLGTLLIVASLWLISGPQSVDRKWRVIDTALPLSAALVSAVSQSLRKRGLMILPDPFVATVMVTSVSLTLFLIFLLVTKRAQSLRMQRKSFFFFLGAAMLATSAQIANFIALGRAHVSVIIPLLNTTPLFTLLFSALFLRDIEQLNARIVLGAILMVSGVVTITSR